jgi:hypothetical protein
MTQLRTSRRRRNAVASAPTPNNGIVAGSGTARMTSILRFGTEMVRSRRRILVEVQDANIANAEVGEVLAVGATGVTGQIGQLDEVTCNDGVGMGGRDRHECQERKQYEQSNDSHRSLAHVG